MFAGVGFIVYYITYLFLQNFYIASCSLFILLIFTLFLFFYSLIKSNLGDSQKTKKIFLYNIWGAIIGSFIGILYATYLHITYKPIVDTNSLLQNKNGVVYSVSNQSAIIQFTENKKIYRLRIFFKNASSILQKRQDVIFKCNNINKIQESSFQLFERIQGISQTCKGDIQIISPNVDFFANIRLKINAWLDSRFVLFPKGSYAESFLIADTTNVNANEMQIFRNMGLAHLFAASGMHLALLYAIVYIPFVWLRLTFIGEILGFIVCTFFLILLDFMLPLLRAYLFLGVYLSLKYFDRKTSSFYNFFFVAWLSEYIYPLSGFSYSFILSYWITACILATYQPIRKVIHIPNKFIKDHLALSFSAFIGALFLSYLLFASVSVLSILYNLALTPLAGFYLGAELIALFVPFFIHIVSAMDMIFRYSIKIHLWLFESHFVGIHHLFTQIWLGFVFITTIWGIVLFVQKKIWNVSKWFWKFIILFFCTFFIQYAFIKQKQFGVKAFPYGVIVYDKKDVYITGKIPDYAIASTKYIFKRIWEAPIKNIYADTNTKEYVEEYFKLPVEQVQDFQNNYSNGLLKVKDYCFIFAKALKYQKNKIDVSTCSKKYLIESKKDIISNEDLQYKISDTTLINRIGFSKWYWNKI